MEIITIKQYGKCGQYSFNRFKTQFGSWKNVLKEAGLAQGNIGRSISEKELFDNLEEVWIKIGEQPRHRDMSPPVSKFSTKPYITQFGSFRNALEKFVEIFNDKNSYN